MGRVAPLSSPIDWRSAVIECPFNQARLMDLEGNLNLACKGITWSLLLCPYWFFNGFDFTRSFSSCFDISDPFHPSAYVNILELFYISPDIINLLISVKIVCTVWEPKGCAIHGPSSSQSIYGECWLSYWLTNHQACKFWLLGKYPWNESLWAFGFT